MLLELDVCVVFVVFSACVCSVYSPWCTSMQGVCAVCSVLTPDATSTGCA